LTGLSEALKKVGQFEKMFKKADERMDRIEKTLNQMKQDINEIKKKLK